MNIDYKKYVISESLELEVSFQEQRFVDVKEVTDYQSLTHTVLATVEGTHDKFSDLSVGATFKKNSSPNKKPLICKFLSAPNIMDSPHFGVLKLSQGLDIASDVEIMKVEGILETPRFFQQNFDLFDSSQLNTGHSDNNETVFSKTFDLLSYSGKEFRLSSVAKKVSKDDQIIVHLFIHS